MKRMFQYAIVLVMVLGISVSAHAGILYFSEDGNFDGLYTLNTSTGAATSVGISGVTGSTVGLAPSDSPDLLYGGQPFGFLHINSDGSGAVEVNTDPVLEGLAYDPTTGILYGWWQETGFDSYDPATGNHIADLADPGADVEGLAYGGGGIIYGLAGFYGPEGYLYSYDIALDAWTFIGDTGIDFSVPGLAYDPVLDILYAKGEQDSYLYAIDPHTASATIIGDTGLAYGGGLAYVQVPEPATLLLFGTGLAGIIVCRRRLRKR